MTKVAFVADCHIGNHARFGGLVDGGINYRCRLALDALARAVEKADSERADHLVICGDLFDTTKPTPQMITRVQDTLSAFNGSVWAIMGNHDMVSEADGDHAIGPLRAVSNVTVVADKPCVIEAQDLSVWLMPFRTGRGSDWLPKQARKLRPGLDHRRTAIAFHLGIADTSTQFFLQKAHDSIQVSELRSLMEANDIDAAFAGNWHDRRKWWGSDRCITQLGALAPTGWDNPGLEGYGTVAVWDGARTEIHEVPGPRFIKDPADIQGLIPADDPNTYFVSARDVDADEREAVQSMLRGKGFQHFEVIASKAQAQRTAKAAAYAARSADTLEQAVSGYVEAMELDPRLEPEDVVALANKYLAL